MTRTTLNWIIGSVCGLLILVGGFFTLPRIIADSVYPLEYTDLIQKHCVEPWGLDPALVASVIKKESGFNTNAVSPVGATGLMQIMPATARSIAGRMGLSSYNLKNPDDSLKMGCQYLAGLMGRYSQYPKDQQIRYALAAYNGGGAAGDRLARSGSDASLARETSNYYRVIFDIYYPAYQSRYDQSIDFVKTDKPTTLWGKIIYGLVGQFLLK